MGHPRYIAVCGPGHATPDEVKLAEEVGRLLAKEGAIVVTGGLGGVMEAACRGACSENGIAVGLLPGDGRETANEHCTVAIPAGLGEARNVLVVRTADAVIAVGGEYGTLSEIALARKLGRTVVGLNTWQLQRDGIDGPHVIEVSTPEEAVRTALRAAGS